MIIKMEFKDITDKRLLAKFLGIKYKELTYILYSKRTENLYQTFEIPKKKWKNAMHKCTTGAVEICST